jgi:hypothetical protein
MALQHKKTLKYFHFAKFTAANFGKFTKFNKTQLTLNLHTIRDTIKQFLDIASGSLCNVENFRTKAELTDF